MEAINIKRLSKIYHLRPSQRDRQHLLDTALHEAVTDHLEPALSEIRIDEREEICIRLVQVHLSFRPDLSQAETVRHWSNVITRQIRRELDQGSPNVVRYQSRFHALLGFAVDIGRRDLKCCWAWNQLGLTNIGIGASLAQAGTQLVNALQREPGAVFNILVELAAQQRLIDCLGELSGDDTVRLLDHLMSEAGVDRHWLQPATATLPAVTAAESFPSGTEPESSLIFSQLRDHPVRVSKLASVVVPRRWAILILLEREPLFFRRPVEIVSAALAMIEKRLLAILSDADAGEVNGWSERKVDVDGKSGSTISRIDGVAAAATATAATVESVKSQPTAGDREFVEAPDTAITSEFAGLFLLLPMLAEVDEHDSGISLIETMAADTALQDRSLAWILYHLTRCWLSIPATDPGLRAFCGIQLDSDWPWPADDCELPSETQRLSGYAQEIEAKILLRFAHRKEDGQQLIASLCRRHARLLIQRGWLELVFSFEQVDTDIRRAGLDLDPGYVRWLGKVVKIRYD